MKHSKMIRPGNTIGILGGGQLGRMLALEGRKMGFRFQTLDPTPDAPCGPVADKQVVAAFDDVEKATVLAAESDVITYEFENVDAGVAEALQKTSHVPQGSELLSVTQHRLREKNALLEAGVPLAPFASVRSREDLETAAEETGFPCVLKTATGGYDGKGQRVIHEREELLPAFETLFEQNGELVLEQFIPFEKEISVVAARNTEGEIKTFTVAENIHENNILHMSVVPAKIEEATRKQAEQTAHLIAEQLGVVGLIAVEMFVAKDGGILVNELAPRPHNSGHYTYDACITSQFEQHLRAICGWPLGSVDLLNPVVMVNILGQHLDSVMERIESLPPYMKLHLYGKKEAKPNRKMGHLNVLAPSTEEALYQIRELEIWEEAE